VPTDEIHRGAAGHRRQSARERHLFSVQPIGIHCHDSILPFVVNPWLAAAL
jgi:hypothetical protein